MEPTPEQVEQKEDRELIAAQNDIKRWIEVLSRLRKTTRSSQIVWKYQQTAVPLDDDFCFSVVPLTTLLPLASLSCQTLR